jgi:hypothetical protein
VEHGIEADYAKNLGGGDVKCMRDGIHNRRVNMTEGGLDFPEGREEGVAGASMKGLEEGV